MMDAMQAIVDFKHNLRQSAHPTALVSPGGGAAKSAAAKPSATAADTTSASGTDSTTITANDFLQLLVAEMKNQDPTADQDPNAYIDQLVQVNSLQQLISINQDLTPATSTASGAIVAGGSRAPAAQAANDQLPGGEATSAQAAAARAAHRQLGTAAGTPAAAVATTLAPRAAQPELAPIAGSLPDPGATTAGGPSSAVSRALALMRR